MTAADDLILNGADSAFEAAVKLLERSGRKIEDAVSVVWTAIVDGDDDRFPVFGVSNFENRAARFITRGGHHFGSVKVVGRFALSCMSRIAVAASQKKQCRHRADSQNSLEHFSVLLL